MAVRHYRLDYSTDGGATWNTSIADEAAGADKEMSVSGLSAGTYAIQLRMVPLDGDTTPIVSSTLVLPLGSAPISEPVQAIATATATLADVLALRDSLLAAVGVSATGTDHAQLADQSTITASVAASVADLKYMFDGLIAAVNSSASVADVAALAEQLVVAIAAQATVADVQSGVILDSVSATAASVITVADTQQIAEQLVAAATAQVSLANLQTMAEQLVISAITSATQTDGMTARESLQAAVTTTATIADVRAMLESVLAAASVQATQGDGMVAREAAVAAASVVPSSADTFVPGAAAPAAPNLTSVAVDTGGITPVYDTVSGATAYDLYYSTGAVTGNEAGQTAASGKISGIAASGNRNALSVTLTVGATYNVALKARNAVGSSSLSSSSSSSAAPRTLTFELGSPSYLTDSHGGVWSIEITAGGDFAPDPSTSVTVGQWGAGNYYSATRSLKGHLGNSYLSDPGDYFSDALVLVSPELTLPAGAQIKFRYKNAFAWILADNVLLVDGDYTIGDTSGSLVEGVYTFESGWSGPFYLALLGYNGGGMFTDCYMDNVEVYA